MSTTIYHPNKYTRWYYSIIENAKALNRKKVFGVYFESHHIIPECIGGIEEVLLTAREHYICHLLLPKMVKSKKHYYQMMFVLNLMKDHMTSRTYESFKIKLAKILSETMKGNKNGYSQKKPHTKKPWSDDRKLQSSLRQKGIPKSEQAKAAMRKPKSDSSKMGRKKGCIPWQKLVGNPGLEPGNVESESTGLPLA